jgi:voltage-gated potassium channel
MSTASERMAKRFQIPTLLAALLVIPVVVIEELNVAEPWRTAGVIANWTIWLVFLAEVVAMLRVVDNQWQWIRRHPLEIAIVVLTPPFLPASLQSARAFRLLRLLRLVVTVRQLKSFFSMDGLRYASVVAIFGIVGGGAFFAAVESTQKLSTWDGVWWAVSTVTTVGYGDIVPKTDAGRLIAIAVMVIGVGYIAMLTAALAQVFLSGLVGKEAKAVEREAHYAEDVVVARLDALAAQLERLELRLLSPSSDVD